MIGGLRDQLGLPERNGGGAISSEVGQRFREAFSAAIADVNQSLQYTAVHAPAASHNPLGAQRDNVYAAYQAVAGRIDPSNPGAGQGKVERVLAAVNTLRTSTSSLRQTTERGVQSWQSRESDFNGASEQVIQLLDGGHDQAAVLQRILDGIQAKVNERAWPAAAQVLDQLLPKLNQIAIPATPEPSASGASGAPSTASPSNGSSGPSVSHAASTATGGATQLPQGAQAGANGAQAVPQQASPAGGRPNAVSPQSATQQEAPATATGLSPEFRAWESDFNNALLMVEELVGAGHPHADVLQQVCNTLQKKASSGDLPTAIDGLNRMRPRLENFYAQLQPSTAAVSQTLEEQDAPSSRSTDSQTAAGSSAASTGQNGAAAQSDTTDRPVDADEPAVAAQATREGPADNAGTQPAAQPVDESSANQTADPPDNGRRETGREITLEEKERARARLVRLKEALMQLADAQHIDSAADVSA